MGDEYSDSFEVTTNLIATRMSFVHRVVLIVHQLPSGHAEGGMCGGGV